MEHFALKVPSRADEVGDASNGGRWPADTRENLAVLMMRGSAGGAGRQCDWLRLAATGCDNNDSVDSF